jgi:Bacterial Ig domain
VLANDTDVDGDTLTVTGDTDGDDGTVSCTTAGVCTYTPDANFNGPDDFTYTISDGNGGSDTATVNVTVTPVNDPPNAVNNNLTTPEDTPGNVNVLTNDTDVDGDTLTVTGDTDGDDGSVSCTAGGVCTYTPDPGFTGDDEFTYTIGDGNGGSDTATVDVTVTPEGDDDPPNTRITKGPKRTMKKRDVIRYRFTSNEAGSTFECKMDDGPWQRCSSPKVYRNLKLGKHTFKVRATDPDGNTDPSPAERTFKFVKKKK